MSFGSKTDFEGLKTDVVTPIREAHDYLKHGKKDEAQNCIDLAEENLSKSKDSYGMDKSTKEDILTQINTEKSLLSVKPEDIDAAYKLINLKSQYSNLNNRLLNDMEKETSRFKESTDKFGTEYSNQDISDSVTNYQTKLRGAISENPIMQEIDDKLKQYGVQNNP